MVNKRRFEALYRKPWDSLTLGEHAELWGYERKMEVPERGDPEWQAFYEDYIEWAFADFAEVKGGET